MTRWIIVLDHALGEWRFVTAENEHAARQALVTAALDEARADGRRLQARTVDRITRETLARIYMVRATRSAQGWAEYDAAMGR